MMALHFSTICVSILLMLFIDEVYPTDSSAASFNPMQSSKLRKQKSHSPQQKNARFSPKIISIQDTTDIRNNSNLPIISTITSLDEPAISTRYNKKSKGTKNKDINQNQNFQSRLLNDLRAENHLLNQVLLHTKHHYKVENELLKREVAALRASEAGNTNNATANDTTNVTSKCSQRADKALKLGLFVVGALKKSMAVFSTAFMVDCKFTEHGGHLGVECVQEHTIKHVDDIAVDSTLILRGDQKIPILELNQMDQCYLPSCSCMHPKELEKIKRTQHDEYSKVIDNPCDKPDINCNHAPSDSKCGTMTRYCKHIQDWYTKRWYLENRSFLDPSAQGAAKQSRFIDCENGKECCAFYLMPGNDADWRENISDDFLKKYCYLAKVYRKGIDFTDGNYFLGSQALPWNQAKEFCDQRNGRLVTPFTEDEYNEAMEFVKYHAPDKRIWLGFNDREKEGTWEDTNDTIMRNVYGFGSKGGAHRGARPWNKGEPNDWDNSVGGEDCVEIKTFQINWSIPAAFRYNDGVCSDKRIPFCKFVDVINRDIQTKIILSLRVKQEFEKFLQEFPMLKKQQLKNGVEYIQQYLNPPSSTLRDEMLSYKRRKRYFFNGPKLMRWDQAQRYCKDNRGRLAAPWTKQESDQARSLCKDMLAAAGVVNDANQGCWLGFNDQKEAKVWRNTNGLVMRNVYGFDHKGMIPEDQLKKESP